MSDLDRATALASVSHTEISEANRRRETRIPQLFRTVHFSVHDELVEFRLRCLSLRGASGSTAQPLEKGCLGTLLFETGYSVLASVRWTRGTLCGLQLAMPLPLDVLHAREGVGRRSHTPRAPRYSIARAATLISARTRRFPVEICNISQGGMLIFGRPTLLPGQVVEIACGAAPVIRCQVRWTRSGYSGLQCTAPISLAEFDELSRT